MIKFLVTISLSLLFISNVAAQFYKQTGKNFGLFIAGSPISSIHIKKEPINSNTNLFSVGLVKMVSAGIYPKIGYSLSVLKNDYYENSSFSVKNFHTLSAGILFDVRIAKLRQKKIGSTCHYLSMGMIASPEYRFTFPSTDINDNFSGEFSGEIGLSFCHVSSASNRKNKSRTRHYDLYYRQGFTPFLKLSDGISENPYMQKEIGLRVRFMFHKVYDFLK
jgi:hypothetical protein